MKILTFNTGLSELSFGPVKIEIIPYVWERLKILPKHITELQADVVCLQEVWGKDIAKKLKRKLEKKYPYHYFSKEWNINTDNGLSVFSKYKFNVIEELSFSGKGVEKIAPKGAVIIQLTEGPFNDVIIANTHFPYGGWGSKSQTFQKTIKRRNRQIEYLNKHLREKTDKIIILGDFNFGPNISRENYRKILSLGYIDVLCGDITWDPKNPLNYMFPFSKAQTIDHIFINKNFFKKIKKIKKDIVFDKNIPLNPTKDSFLSDHYGVLVEIK